MKVARRIDRVREGGNNVPKMNSKLTLRMTKKKLTFAPKRYVVTNTRVPACPNQVEGAEGKTRNAS